jgi:hypothetical protein
MALRLMEGTDLSVGTEHLEMIFEQIAELVNQYRTNYSNTKKLSGSQHGVFCNVGGRI